MRTHIQFRQSCPAGLLWGLFWGPEGRDCDLFQYGKAVYSHQAWEKMLVGDLVLNSVRLRLAGLQRPGELLTKSVTHGHWPSTGLGSKAWCHHLGLGTWEQANELP